jgi:ABC-type multidrug transport system fused ATPase/permease subunit
MFGAAGEPAALLASTAFLHALERVALFATGLSFARQAPAWAAASAAGLAVLFAARSALQAALSRHVRGSLVDTAVRTLLRASVLRRPRADLGVTVHEGIYFGQQLAALAPALMGDLGAIPFVGIAMSWVAPPRVTALAALALLAAAAPTLAARAWTTRLVLAGQEAFGPIYDDLGNAIAGRLEIVAAGRADEFQNQVLAHLARWREVAIRSDAGVALAGRAPALAAAAAVGLVLAVDIHSRDAIAGGALGAAVLGASAVPAFLGLSRGIVDSARTTARVRPFLSLLQEELAPVGAIEAAASPHLPCPIEWSKVSFAYDAETGGESKPVALRDVNISWQPGQILVLHGPNGSGKSTLLRLLLGLARPTAGQITVGGQDLFGLNLRAWRQTVAYLPQRPYLPERASAREAVRWLLGDVNDERLRQAVSRVGLLGALSSHSPHDPLGTRVGALSTGERQRLALARLLCHASRVVLLDEPDANLDAAGIRLVANLVRELASDHMVAVAAHTEEIVSQGDLRVELVDGARRT